MRSLYWVIGTFVFTVLITGVIFGFNYRDNLDVQLHDTYFVLYPIQVGVILWVILSAIVFLIVGFKTRFSKTVATWILLIVNSLIILFLLTITASLSLLATRMYDDIPQEATPGNITALQYTHILTTFIALSIIFLSGEFLLIKRLIKLQTVT